MQIKPYGCKNRTIRTGYYVKVRKYSGEKYEMVDKWVAHNMSTDCRYDKKEIDERCKDCKYTAFPIFAE